MTAKIAVGAHYGLRDWLSQRITAVGGRLEVDSPAGEGTTVRVELPAR